MQQTVEVPEALRQNARGTKLSLSQYISQALQISLEMQSQGTSQTRALLKILFFRIANTLFLFFLIESYYFQTS
jgi:hypothetical protein